jgi:hypothetical protein
MIGPAESRGRTTILTAGAAALMLVGSFLNFLNYNQYPIGNSEVPLALAGLVVASVLLGLITAGLGVFGRILIPPILVVLAVDINVDGRPLLLLLGILAAILCNRISRQALILLFGVVIVSQAWTAIAGEETVSHQTTSAATTPATADFAVVHLILDEHIGLDGIPVSVPGGAEMRAQLRDFYVGKGFRIFAGAYSESMRTVHAIPRAFSLEAASAWRKGGRSGTTLEDNPYFDALQSAGLRIDVSQTDWIDYCGHAAVASCMTRAAGGLIDVGDKLPVSDKAVILIYRFAALSSLAQTVLRLYDLLALSGRLAGFDPPVVQLLKRTVTSTPNAMASFDEVIGAARSLAPGKAIFAHLLLPHYPYVYDQRCGTRRLGDWLGRASAVPWETRYQRYFEQVTCTTRKVEELLAAVASSPAAGKTVFLIHGDHGSRITHVDPSVERGGAFSDRDVVDGHAAFFAVLAPGVEPGYDTGRYPLRLLLHALTRSGFREVVPELPAGFVPSIALEDIRRNPVAELAVEELDWWQGRSEDADGAKEVVP